MRARYSGGSALVAGVLLALALATPCGAGAVEGAQPAPSPSSQQGGAAVRGSAERAGLPATARAGGPPSRSGWLRARGLEDAETSQALRIALGLTLLAIVPALIVSVTPFLRSIIVLSMLRHGLGMTQTPPNTVLIGLSLFLTMFTMAPVMQRIDQEAFRPFMAGTLSMDDGFARGIAPLREFMVRQTREEDLALMIEISRAPPPRTMDEVGNVQLVPAYMLSELRAAFQIGFVVLLPFLLIDLVVSSILMALGMMMMPPTAVSLPLKVMMFLLVDGWSLLVKALAGSIR